LVNGFIPGEFLKDRRQLSAHSNEMESTDLKNSSNIIGLSMILPQKWLPPLRIMFEQLNCRLRAAALRSFPQQFMGDDNG